MAIAYTTKLVHGTLFDKSKEPSKSKPPTQPKSQKPRNIDIEKARR